MEIRHTLRIVAVMLALIFPAAGAFPGQDVWADEIRSYNCVRVVREISEGDYLVVDTAQTTCYDNTRKIPCPESGEPFYGQDAQYQGTDFAFQDNGDGTATDLNTGLMWQNTPDFVTRSWKEVS